MIEPESKRKNSSFVLNLGLLLLCIATLALIWRGAAFYGLSREDRVMHEDYRILGAAGFLGHGYGFIGTGLILLNLTYLLRRLFPRMALGSMKAWLDMHVLTGLAGGALVLFHSAFQFRTPIAIVSTVSVGVVVFTGIIGRALHAFTPRTNKEALENAVVALDAIVPRAGEHLRSILVQTRPTPVDAHAGLISVLTRIPVWLYEWRTRRVAVRRGVVQVQSSVLLDSAHDAMVQRIRGELVRQAGLEVFATMTSGLLLSWRSLHRVLAILMTVTVPFHVVIAWMYGYRWIFSAE